VKKILAKKTFRSLVFLSFSCFLLFLSVTPVLAAICGVDSPPAVCCPQDLCRGDNFGQYDCEPGSRCCESCAPKPGEVGNIGEAFRLGKGRSIAEVFPTFGSLISTLLPNIYLLAGLILFVLLLFGGFGIIMGAQGGNPDQVGKGKNAVVAALAGFFLIFASYWIIQIVEKLTGIDIFNPEFF
jgi:hypothetical protein